MTNNRDGVSDHLTFSQRYGHEPLPQPMQLEELSDDLRREIWNLVYRFLKRFYYVPDSMGLLGKSKPDVDGEIWELVVNIFGKLYKLPQDEILLSLDWVQSRFKKTVMHEKFNKVLDLIQIVANSDSPTGVTVTGNTIVQNQYSTRFIIHRNEFILAISEQFNRHAAPYWLDMSQRSCQFFPRSSRGQGEATQQAIETIRESGMKGASTHLRDAAARINEQRFADSVKDSIHAVESVACIIDNKASKTLTPALDSLEKAGLLNHPALKQGFEKLYGYASDEQGIRHALLDKGAPDVDVDEAVFMFGACASFAAYLVNKHRQMQQHQKNFRSS